MPAYVTRTASGQLASYDTETMVAMFVDADGKAAIEAAALANGTVDITYLSELTTFELARTTFTAEVDEVLGKIDVAADEDPTADTDGETVAGIVIALDAGSDAARTVVACHTFTPRAGSTADAVVFSNETGFASWQPAPGTIVRGIGTVRPDAEGIINSAELAALLGTGGGGSVEPILVTAEASSTVDLTDHYDNGRPVVVTIEGTSNDTRPEVLWGDPAEHVGQVVIHLPARVDTPGDYIYGASVGWHIGATPGVLGDLGASWVAGFGDLDFAASPETFTFEVGGVPYTATLDADFTGDPVGAISALAGSLLGEGTPLTVETNYRDFVGGRVLDGALVSTVTGAAGTIEVTDAGTGDRMNLLGLVSTPGLDQAHEGYNGTLLGTGELNFSEGGQTHSWFDTYLDALKSLVVISDGTQWASVVRRVDAPMVPYTPVTPADWTEGAPAYVGNALDILAARAGGGGVSLGETSTTAYRGDRGKTAYDHSQLTSGNPHGTTVSDLGAVPTSRTLAGLDLTTNRSDSDLRSAVSVAPRRVIVPDSVYASGTGRGTCVTNAIGRNTQAIGLGDAWGGMVDVSGAATNVVFNITATALTAGQAIIIYVYALGTDGLPTGTPVDSKSVTVGTATGVQDAAWSRTWTPGEFVCVLNPSTNSGSVTLTTVIPAGNFTCQPSSTNNNAIACVSQGTAMGDVSAYTVAAPATATGWGTVPFVPMICAR